MTYRYRDIGKYLVCVDQSLINAVRTFVLGFDSNKLSSLGVSRSIATNVVKVLAREKFRHQGADDYETLPAFGHLGMKVHRGYKLFDFDASRVTKVFAAGVERNEADIEIAASREASAVNQAPRFVDSDPASAWFSEEYVRGIHATDLVGPDSGDYLRYYADVENCLLELLDCTPPVAVNAMDYINDLANNAYRDRWLKAGFSVQDVDQIAAYTERLRAWLTENLSGKTLQLIRTHGDFSLVNAISANNGLRIIDWEGIGPGSLYSDIFNFAFAEHYYGRSSRDFVSEVKSVTERFGEAVVRRHPALRDATMMSQTIARRLYYLERVRLMAHRDVTPNLHNVIGKSIAMFEKFDRSIGDPPLQVNENDILSQWS
jgi:hypothetical protein